MRTTGWAGRFAVSALAAVFAAAATPPSVGASVTIGETFTPSSGCLASTYVLLQTTAPADRYLAPTNGVITSWSFEAGTVAPTHLRLHVGRALDATTFQTIGRSAIEEPSAGVVNTYPTRVPVLAGDVIGIGVSAAESYQCYVASPGNAWHQLPGDPKPGTSTIGSPSPGLKVPVAAKLEPDGDGDGFGDETQDSCPTDPSTQLACPDKVAPDTALTKKPRKKRKKKNAEFRFSSSEPGVFFCSLNGASPKPCTSPHAVKAKKGKNRFAVFSTDAAGNVDASPATYSWTFKKKQPKR